MTQEGNKLFPIFLKLENFHVLIVGGGKIGMEKIFTVLNNSPETRIKLIAKTILPELKEFVKGKENVTLIEKEYQQTDLNEIDFVITAVNDIVLTTEIKQEAQKRKILVNAADKPEQCDFYLGSVVKKGDLKIAISTNGKSPTLAKRLREMLEDVFPDEAQETLENLAQIRSNISGDFTDKVKQLNEITSVLVDKQGKKKSKAVIKTTLYSIVVITLLVMGHLLFTYVPFSGIKELFSSLTANLDPDFSLYIFGGFIAQMIDGAFGMAYGVTVTTFLLSLGIPAITPAVASATMHASEIFTTGTSSLVYMRYKNINRKLFRALVIPSALGAVAGAAAISFVSKEYITVVKPFVALYTLILGALIIIRTIRVSNHKAKKIKKIIPVAAAGGFLDSVGGGGWGPIVTTSLIAGGRNLRYAIGSSHLAKFFVAIVSTITFFSIIGVDHWQIIFGIVLGGMIAAPMSIYFSNKIPVKKGLIFVGALVIIVSLRIIIKAFL